MAIALSTAIEIALVGPLISCRDESKIGPDRGHHDRGVEAVLRGEPRDHRVRHGLGHGDRGDRQPGDRIRARVGALYRRSESSAGTRRNSRSRWGR